MSMKSDMSMEQPEKLEDRHKSTHLRYNIFVRHTYRETTDTTNNASRAEFVKYSLIKISEVPVPVLICYYQFPALCL